MFKQSFFAVLVLAFAACTGDRAMITGSVGEIEGAVVTVQTLDFKDVLAADTVKNGSFSLSPAIDKSDFYRLNFDGKSPKQGGATYLWSPSIMVYLEKDKSYTFSFKNLKAIFDHDYQVRTDSKLQTELAVFDRFYYSTVVAERDRLDSLKKVGDQLVEKDQIEQYNLLFDSLNVQRERYHQQLPFRLIREYASENPESIIAVSKLLGVPDLENNYPEYNRIAAAFSKEVRQSAYGKQFIRELESVKLVSKGAVFPEISGKDLSGNPFESKYSKHKFTLVDFWASWCKPCRLQHPELAALYREFGAKGLDIVSISLDDDEPSWRKAVIADKLPWPRHYSELVPLKRSNNRIRFNASSIPLNYLIDNNGKIVARNIELAQLRHLLKNTNPGPLNTN